MDDLSEADPGPDETAAPPSDAAILGPADPAGPIDDPALALRARLAGPVFGAAFLLFSAGLFWMTVDRAGIFLALLGLPITLIAGGILAFPVGRMVRGNRQLIDERYGEE